MNSDISIREVFSPSRRKRPKLTGDSESDSDEDLTDCDSETAKKEVEELEEALLRKEAEIKDLNYELEKEREKYEEYVASTVEKEKTNKQTISKQQEEIIKLRKDNDDLKNLVEYLKEENKNLNEILSATALGSARSLDKHKNHTITDDSNNMIVPDDFTPVNVAIKKEPPDPVEIQDYLELGTENCKEESLLPVVGETPVSSVTDSELKVATEKSAGPSKISKVVDKVQNASARSSLSVPSASNCKPQDQSEEESSSQGNGQDAGMDFFGCHLCIYNTNDKMEFEAHMRLHIGVCDQCDFASPNPKELATHRFNKHNVVKRYKCDQCDYLAKHPTELNTHSLVHANDRPFRCDLCDYSSKWQSSLMRHKQMHACGGFKCELCGFSAATQNNLKKHELIHARGRVFQCDLCQASFKHRHRLFKHRQTHTGEKPFKCDECEYATSKKGNLIVHKRTHTGERPYSCEFCGYSFKVRSDLTRHVKRMHVLERIKVGEPNKLRMLLPKL